MKIVFIKPDTFILPEKRDVEEPPMNLHISNNGGQVSPVVFKGTSSQCCTLAAAFVAVGYRFVTKEELSNLCK